MGRQSTYRGTVIHQSFYILFSFLVSLFINALFYLGEFTVGSMPGNWLIPFLKRSFLSFTELLIEDAFRCRLYVNLQQG